MDLNLTGKIALVTGAGSDVGFGRGIALVLAREGCDIVVNDINEEGARQTAVDVEALKRKAMAIRADVTKVDEVNEMVTDAINRFGKIDILVNNAGRATNPIHFVETPEANWQTVFNLNIYGVFYCTQAVLPQMINRQSGKIINISSGAAFSGMPRNLAYAASKAAIVTFTKGLAKEVTASGIRVNAVAPGLGDTHFLDTAGYPEGEIDRALNVIPTKKTTTPEDVGNMVAYLASDIASQIVGQTFLVDGGMQG